MATAPTLTLAGVFSYVEGNSGSRTLSIPVTRAGDLSKPSSCQWKVVGDTDAADYVGPVSGTLSWPARSGLARISLAIRGDTTYEADETSRIEISGEVNCVVQTNTVQIVIRNDDKAAAPAPSPPAPVPAPPAPVPTPTPTPAPAPVPAPPAPVSAGQLDLSQFALTYEADFQKNGLAALKGWRNTWWYFTADSKPDGWQGRSQGAPNNDPTKANTAQNLQLYGGGIPGVNFEPVSMSPLGNGLRLSARRITAAEVPALWNWSGGWLSGILNLGPPGFDASWKPLPPVFEQRLGYWECSFMFSPGAGVWPAFWAMDVETNQELDIVEGIGSKPMVMQTTIHNGGTRGGVWPKVLSADPSKRMVTIGCEWTETQIIQYVDRVESNRFDIAGLDMSAALYPVLNLAIGSGATWPDQGPPDASTPANPWVDFGYVRTYRRLT